MLILESETVISHVSSCIEWKKDIYAKARADYGKNRVVCCLLDIEGKKMFLWDLEGKSTKDV